MAIKLVGREYCAHLDDYRHEYICDADVDFMDLPKSCVGSTALSTSGAIRMVNASGEWVPFGE